jgi:hypothetical protein
MCRDRGRRQDPRVVRYGHGLGNLFGDGISGSRMVEDLGHRDGIHRRCVTSNSGDDRDPRTDRPQLCQCLRDLLRAASNSPHVTNELCHGCTWYRQCVRSEASRSQDLRAAVSRDGITDSLRRRWSKHSLGRRVRSGGGGGGRALRAAVSRYRIADNLRRRLRRRKRLEDGGGARCLHTAISWDGIADSLRR